MAQFQFLFHLIWVPCPGREPGKSPSAYPCLASHQTCRGIGSHNMAEEGPEQGECGRGGGLSWVKYTASLGEGRAGHPRRGESPGARSWWMDSPAWPQRSYEPSYPSCVCVSFADGNDFPAGDFDPHLPPPPTHALCKARDGVSLDPFCGSMPKRGGGYDPFVEWLSD